MLWVVSYECVTSHMNDSYHTHTHTLSPSTRHPTVYSKCCVAYTIVSCHTRPTRILHTHTPSTRHPTVYSKCCVTSQKSDLVREYTVGMNLRTVYSKCSVTSQNMFCDVYESAHEGDQTSNICVCRLADSPGHSSE